MVKTNVATVYLIVYSTVSYIYQQWNLSWKFSIYSISHAHSYFRRVYRLVSGVMPCHMPHTWLIASPHHICIMFHLTKSCISIHAIFLIFEFSDVCVTSILSKQIGKSLMLGHTHPSSLVLKRIQKDILYMTCILIMLQCLAMSHFMKIIFHTTLKPNI